ncbi:MAG: class I SAM-dependent methyltransferase [Pseudomonadota bacterium]
MWNDRYNRPDYLFGTEPAEFLKVQARHLPSEGRVLVVADGEGRNSVFLAERGLMVTAFDYAPNALAKAEDLAKQKGVEVDFLEADVFAWDWSADSYDAVVAIFIQFMPPQLRVAVFEGLKAALKPGGVLLLHGYAPRQVEYGTGGPPVAENMYTLPLLEAAFAGFEVLHSADYDAEIDEGPGHSGLSGLIDYVVRKPVG